MVGHRAGRTDKMTNFGPRALTRHEDVSSCSAPGISIRVGILGQLCGEIERVAAAAEAWCRRWNEA